MSDQPPTQVTVTGNDLASILDDHQVFMLGLPADEQDWTAHDHLRAAHNAATGQTEGDGA